MKDKLIKDVLHQMAGIIDSRQSNILHEVLIRCLQEVEITETLDLSEKNKAENVHFLEIFLSAKRVEGCSEKTLGYYHSTIEKMFITVAKWVKDITTDDLRTYLSDYQCEHHSSKVTIDNIRRIFSSFFSWLEDEDYILKSPVRRIHK